MFMNQQWGESQLCFYKGKVLTISRDKFSWSSFLSGPHGIGGDAGPWHTSVSVLMTHVSSEVSLECRAVDDLRSPLGLLSILFSGKRHHWRSLPYTCTNTVICCIYRGMGYDQKRCLHFLRVCCHSW